MALVASKSDKFSQQVRNAVVGALALGLGLAFSACFAYAFVLHDKTETISVTLQFALLVLYSVVFTLLLCVVLALWNPDYTIQSAY